MSEFNCFLIAAGWISLIGVVVHYLAGTPLPF